MNGIRVPWTALAVVTCAIACTMPDGRSALDALALMLCGGLLVAAGVHCVAVWRDAALDE